ncbi:hypothetical protein EYF80_033079 [Liparis tanakae]|uniref:Uncharacterized protein n=1 Tax=Liparis tanakae TaxID=230148 RepID=A0A4Z2GVY7_9TELE|nr:hypothetical protein EYF80_033079 [Liparis tanakae]
MPVVWSGVKLKVGYAPWPSYCLKPPLTRAQLGYYRERLLFIFATLMKMDESRSCSVKVTMSQKALTMK